MRCPECGFPIDLDNESQPVCPACSADPFPPSLPAFQGPGGDQISRLQARYKYHRSGLYRETLLQDVCLECGSRSVRKEKSTRECENSRCRARWYINRCGNDLCLTNGRRTSIDSRDEDTIQCPSCGWYKCPVAVCSSCEENCPLFGKASA